MAPHSAQSFDHSRHLCGGDVVFTSKYVQILIKWTKTVQTRDKIHVLSLPKLATPLLCSYSALKDIFAAYNPLPDDQLFQIKQQRVCKSSSTPASEKSSHPSIFVWVTPKISLPSTLSGVQGPLWPTTLMSLFIKFNIMAPGRRTVCGGTLSKIKNWERILLILLLLW